MTQGYCLSFESPITTVDRLAEKTRIYLDTLFEIFEKRNIKFEEVTQYVRLYGVNNRLERKGVYSEFTFHYEKQILAAALEFQENLDSIQNMIEVIPNNNIKAKTAIHVHYEGSEISKSDLKMPNLEIKK